MQIITTEFKQKITAALIAQRINYPDSSDKDFSIMYGINNSIYSLIKSGNIDKKISPDKWLILGRKLGINLRETKWKIVRTDVFDVIEEEIMACKEHSLSRIFVDDTEIGKTETARYLSQNMSNCFYVDCSQAKTKQQFIRLIARTVGIPNDGKYIDVQDNLKYYLKTLTMPVIILDEAGDLEYTALLEVKELWNATEGCCGWYMIGADGLQAKIIKGISHKKVGFREIFSRFNSKYGHIEYDNNEDKMRQYQHRLRLVIEANVADKTQVEKIIAKCLKKDHSGLIRGLRTAKTQILLNKAA